MKIVKLRQTILTLMLASLFQPLSAYASILSFDVFDNPHTINHPDGNTDPWSLIFDRKDDRARHFDAQSLSFQVDTESGDGLLQGILRQRSTGAAVELVAHYQDFRSELPLSDQIFQSAAETGSNLYWDSSSYSLTMLGGLAPFEVWTGKANSGGNTSIFSVYSIDDFPHAAVFSFSSWFMPVVGEGASDIHVLVHADFPVTPQQPVPEPATLLLLGAATGIAQRLRNANRAV